MSRYIPRAFGGALMFEDTTGVEVLRTGTASGPMGNGWIGICEE